MLTSNPDQQTEDVAAELAAALPQTQGPRFFPMLRRLAYHLLAFLLVGGAAFVLWREFHHLRPADLAAAVRAWGWTSVAAAVGLAALSFSLMGVVEWLGLRWAGCRIGIRSALAGSFVANAIAHSLGANLIVSGAVRARYYARRGVSLRQVAAATLFHGFAFAVGLSTLAGFSLLAAPSHHIAAASRIANPVADSAGALLLGAVAAYVVLCGVLRRPLSVFGHAVRLPTPRLALAQIGLGAADNAVAAAIIWVLLPAGSIDYLTFVGGYAPSVVIGLISHVPGGVGVFEGSLSTILKGLDPASLAAALLGYRLFFFLCPLVLAAAALAFDALRERAGALR